MRNLRGIILSIIAFALLGTAAYGQLSPNPPKREMRAVWLTTLNGLDWPTAKATGSAGIERQKQELRNTLDMLQAANFNTIVMQARIRAAVIYPSRIEPWDACLTGRAGQDPGYDPLQFAVEECHRRGMQIHAWVVAIPGNKTAQSKAMGASALEKRKPGLVLRTSEGVMLDPGVPESADYLASICEEITRNYDIDGISLDYIRYPEKEIKFSDAATYKKYAKAGESLANWRRDNITRCVKAVHDRVKAIKPWVAISCSPVGKYNDTQRYSAGGWNAYSAVSQDPKLWLREGWMDILMPMMYFKGNHYFPFALDWQEGAAGRCIATGLGVYLIDRNQKDWPRSIMESEIEFDRTHGLGGQVFFRSRFITDNPKGIYTLLKNNLYRTKALVPALVGEDIPTPSAPTDAAITQAPNATVFSWQGPEGCTYVLYRSHTYPVDTDNGANICQTNLKQPQYTVGLPTPLEFMPYYAVTAINRYGKESAPLHLNPPHQFIEVKGVRD